MSRVRIPDVQVRHRRRTRATACPVAADGGHDVTIVPALLTGKAVPPRRETSRLAASRVDVPFPGAGQRLVEVVDVEHQAALGRAKDAEVGQVRVAARLHREPGDRVAARSLAIGSAAPR